MKFKQYLDESKEFMFIRAQKRTLVKKEKEYNTFKSIGKNMLPKTKKKMDKTKKEIDKIKKVISDYEKGK